MQAYLKPTTKFCLQLAEQDTVLLNWPTGSAQAALAALFDKTQHFLFPCKVG
jgi:hypothetical protein